MVSTDNCEISIFHCLVVNTKVNLLLNLLETRIRLWYGKAKVSKNLFQLANCFCRQEKMTSRCFQKIYGFVNFGKRSIFYGVWFW